MEGVDWHHAKQGTQQRVEVKRPEGDLAEDEKAARLLGLELGLGLGLGPGGDLAEGEQAARLSTHAPEMVTYGVAYG